MADRDEAGRFVTGNSGGGRPKGSRNKLGEQFLCDLATDWDKHGAEAIAACRRDKPAEYVKVVAGLLPKELLVRTDPIDDMSDEELADALRKLDTLIAIAQASGGGERPN